MSRKEQYSMVLLAGGKSTRMGRDKAKLLYGAQSFAKTLLCKGREIGIEKIYVSGFEEEGFETIWDIYPETGPLGGLHACMKAVQTNYCLVLPVDVPQIPIELLEELLIFHEEITACIGPLEVPVLIKHGQRRENLIGIYPTKLHSYIEERILQKRLSVHGMLDCWGCFCMETTLPEWQIENINTRETYEEVLRKRKEG